MKFEKQAVSALRATAVVLVALTLGVAGCDQPKPKAPAPPAAEPEASREVPKKDLPKIALVMKSLANEFFLTMENGAKAHQAEHGADYELIANGIKDEQDVARQIDLVEQMIAQRVDAIVIAPADSKAMVSVCERALAAGIVIVNIDNKFDDAVLADKGLSIPFVGPDNRKGAALAGKHLATQLHAGDEVAIIEGVPNAFNAVQRRLGFEDAIKEAGLTLATSQAGNWEMDKANQVAASIIIEHTELKAILCANDNMALGAVAALKAAGKTDAIKVVGFDNISSVQRLITEGKIVCTVDQHADLLAVYGIEIALKILGGEQQPDDHETPVDLITAEDLQ